MLATRTAPAGLVPDPDERLGHRQAVGGEEGGLGHRRGLGPAELVAEEPLGGGHPGQTTRRLATTACSASVSPVSFRRLDIVPRTDDRLSPRALAVFV